MVAKKAEGRGQKAERKPKPPKGLTRMIGDPLYDFESVWVPQWPDDRKKLCAKVSKRLGVHGIIVHPDIVEWGLKALEEICREDQKKREARAASSGRGSKATIA